MTTSIPDPIDGPQGQALWARADRVLPGGGIYLSRSADLAGRGVIPGFIVAAQGCRVTDADGRVYLDLLGANGPNLLGYRHPEVEAAFAEQAARMTSASLFPDTLVELVERLVARFAPMDWGVLSKNGSEVVSLGLRVARQHTQRPLVVGFFRAYHGNDPELAAQPVPGVLTERTREVLRTPWNDAAALLELARAQGSQIAAIVVNPLDQRPGIDTTDASAAFVAAIEQVRREHGVLVVFDDVRHGFRLHPQGSYRLLPIEPDCMTLGKALGNGYSVSALLGRADLRRAARKIMYTSTYMFEAPPMAAALATLAIYDRDQVFDRLTRAGERLRDGLLAAARQSGHAIRYSGPVTVPTLLLDNDPQQQRLRVFAREAAGLGAILHPMLNWNLSAAHSDADIDAIVDIAAQAFRRTPLANPVHD